MVFAIRENTAFFGKYLVPNTVYSIYFEVEVHLKSTIVKINCLLQENLFCNYSSLRYELKSKKK